MYEWEILIQGFPGRAQHHGGLGWSTVALVQDTTRKILIDTGGPGYRPLLLSALSGRGLDPSAITHVLLTHCHWDHVMNVSLFPEAEVIVAATELEWATRQPVGSNFISEADVDRLNRMADGSVRLVAPDEEAVPGIGVVGTPGHTPGHVSYLATTGAGEILFAGDAVKNRLELATTRADMTLDAAASEASIRRLAGYCAAEPARVLVPGHDAPLHIVSGKVSALAPLRAEIVAISELTLDQRTFGLTESRRSAERARGDLVDGA